MLRFMICLHLFVATKTVELIGVRHIKFNVLNELKIQFGLAMSAHSISEILHCHVLWDGKTIYFTKSFDLFL